MRERNFRILDLLIYTTQMMVEGELLQLEKLGQINVTEEEHLDLIRRKTACLFDVSMRLGAVLSGKENAEEELGEYGRNMGTAFQLVDDLLDFTASESTLGKPVGSDLREGKVTLPLIYALRRCTPEERRRVETVIEERAFHSVTQQEILDILARYGTPADVMVQATEYGRRAVSHLKGFPDSPYLRALESLPEFILHREH